MKSKKRLPTDARMLELLRGYIAMGSTETTCPDMRAERHIIAVMQLAAMEALAINQVKERQL